jgi:hypothetical protein
LSICGWGSAVVAIRLASHARVSALAWNDCFPGLRSFHRRPL